MHAAVRAWIAFVCGWWIVASILGVGRQAALLASQTPASLLDRLVGTLLVGSSTPYRVAVERAWDLALASSLVAPSVEPSWIAGPGASILSLVVLFAVWVSLPLLLARSTLSEGGWDRAWPWIVVAWVPYFAALAGVRALAAHSSGDRRSQPRAVARTLFLSVLAYAGGATVIGIVSLLGIVR